MNSSKSAAVIFLWFRNLGLSVRKKGGGEAKTRKAGLEPLACDIIQIMDRKGSIRIRWVLSCRTEKVGLEEVGQSFKAVRGVSKECEEEYLDNIL